jgi:nicotinamidase-related amidase
MPAKNHDLHGHVPDKAEVALLLIDVINDMEFEGSQPLFEQVMQIAEHMAALKRHARQAGIPVVYVNDNFGRGNEQPHHDSVRDSGARAAS